MKQRDFLLGVIAGLGACLVMYAGNAAFHTQTIPDLVQQKVLAALPGPLFGFLIDNLQHAGKVLAETSTIVVLVLSLGLLGAGYFDLARRASLVRPWFLLVGGWLLLSLVVLPLLGDGFFASDEGPKGAAIWLVVFAMYAGILRLGRQGWYSRPTSRARRRALQVLFIGVGSVALGSVTIRLVSHWVAALAGAPENALVGISPALTPAANFYVVSKNVDDPVVQASTWALRVDGLCERPLTLTVKELAALPSKSEYVTLECISNPVGGKLMSTGNFTGVGLRDLVELSLPKTEAVTIIFQARDGYTESMDLDAAMNAPEILVAYGLNGGPLPPQHGFPARLVVPNRYGMKGPKWLETITLGKGPRGGFWEAQGWNPDAPVQVTVRFDVPAFPAFTNLSPLAIGGVAFGGMRGISEVEWSSDGGKSWHPAQLDQPLSPLTWRRWSSRWIPEHEGVFSLTARAKDESGQLQSQLQKGSFPDGAAGYHTIVVVVTR